MIFGAIGIDMAFANMGLSHVLIDGKTITIRTLRLVTTEAETTKVVRKSSDGLRRAIELRQALIQFCHDCPAQFAFVEVPTGSQSASAARALGIAVGVLASCPLPIIEVSPMEVKEAVTGNRKIKATKGDVIAWATKQWPDAPWIKNHGRIIKANEHLADAMAAVVAGIKTPEFQRTLTLMNHATAASIRNTRRILSL